MASVAAVAVITEELGPVPGQIHQRGLAIPSAADQQPARTVSDHYADQRYSDAGGHHVVKLGGGRGRHLIKPRAITGLLRDQSRAHPF